MSTIDSQKFLKEKSRSLISELFQKNIVFSFNIVTMDPSASNRQKIEVNKIKAKHATPKTISQFLQYPFLPHLTPLLQAELRQHFLHGLGFTTKERYKNTPKYIRSVVNQKSEHAYSPPLAQIPECCVTDEKNKYPCMVHNGA